MLRFILENEKIDVEFMEAVYNYEVKAIPFNNNSPL